MYCTLIQHIKTGIRDRCSGQTSYNLHRYPVAVSALICGFQVCNRVEAAQAQFPFDPIQAKPLWLTFAGAATAIDVFYCVLDDASALCGLCWSCRGH
jgi:hypothetical protein